MRFFGLLVFVVFSINCLAQPPEKLGSRNIKDPILIVDDVIISQKRFQKADSLKVQSAIDSVIVSKSEIETKSVFGSSVETGIIQIATKKPIFKIKPLSKQKLNKDYKLEKDSPIYVNGYLLNENLSIDKRSVYSTDIQMLNYDNEAHFVLNVFVEPKTSKNSYVYKCGFARELEHPKTEPIEFSKENMGKCFYVCNADEGDYYLRITFPKFGFVTDTLSQDEVSTLNSEIKYKNLFLENPTDKDDLHCIDGYEFEVFCLGEENRVPSFDIVSKHNDSLIVKREILTQKLLIERLESNTTPEVKEGQILKKVGEKPEPKVFVGFNLPSGGSRFIEDIQLLLNENGYNLEVTNTLTDETKEAVNSYCRKHGFLEDILSIDFVKSLGYEKPGCICEREE